VPGAHVARSEAPDQGRAEVRQHVLSQQPRVQITSTWSRTPPELSCQREGRPTRLGSGW